ncbi:MAG: PH domain-containing protein [bacterium]|nr:PH domain-containing protein [bacterium]
MHESEQETQHRELVTQRLSNEGRKYFKYIEFDENEELIAEIRKHPIGTLLILLTGALVILAILIITGLLLSFDINGFVGEGNVNGMKPIFVLLAGFLIFGTVSATLIGLFLYRNNVIYVTNEKIAQVLYTSIFHRKISQLSIGDVQDVTVTQNGLVAHMFDYGTLVIETAGEQQNYSFTYVPDPYQHSKLIVGAHERNLVQYGN